MHQKDHLIEQLCEGPHFSMNCCNTIKLLISKSCLSFQFELLLIRFINNRLLVSFNNTYIHMCIASLFLMNYDNVKTKIITKIQTQHKVSTIQCQDSSTLKESACSILSIASDNTHVLYWKHYCEQAMDMS